MGLYRIKGGTEIVLVIDSGKKELWAVEIKQVYVRKLSSLFYQPFWVKLTHRIKITFYLSEKLDI